MRADVRRTPDGAPIYPEDARAELAEELAGVTLDAFESRTLLWLFNLDQPTIHGIVLLIRKARAMGEAP